MRKFIILFFILSECFLFTAASGAEVIGYFASWKWYRRNKLVNPSTIDYTKFTIINYAFFRPMANGTITSGDAYADGVLLKGNSCGENNKASLISMAHSHGVKVLASIGGGTWSADFGTIAASEEKRQAFADACVQLIRKYNFDGIDIDWEFPGSKGKTSEKENFTLLLRAIRSRLDGEQLCKGSKLLLTAAFGPAPVHMQSVAWNLVIPLLDHINLMTYNYHGAWDNISNHHAPLYQPAAGGKHFNIHASVSLLADHYHVPRHKINMGIAFYGRSVIMKDKAELHKPTLKTPDITMFPTEKGSPSYYNILEKMHHLTKRWDEKAGVPYFINGKTFLSCDDEKSISMKAAYVLKNGLSGVVIWDISGDCINNGNKIDTPLLDAISEVFSPVLQARHHGRTTVPWSVFSKP